MAITESNKDELELIAELLWNNDTEVVAGNAGETRRAGLNKSWPVPTNVDRQGIVSSKYFKNSESADRVY